MTERPEEIWERRISDALDRVPGYRGYRLKEERRDADRRVRAAVADAYAAELARVERIGRDLANARRLGEISAVERTSQAIRHYIDRVRSATPGYGGLFGDRDIDGIALDQLRLFDESLLLGVDELRPAIDRLEARLCRRSAARPSGGRSRPHDRIAARSLQYPAGGDRDWPGHQSRWRPGGSATGSGSHPPGRLLRAAGRRDLDPGRQLSRRRQDRRRRPAPDRSASSGSPASRRSGCSSAASQAEPMFRLTPVTPPNAARTSPAPTCGKPPWERETARSPANAGRKDCARCGTLSSKMRKIRIGFGLILDWEGERQAFVGRRAEPLDVELFRHIETAG